MHHSLLYFCCEFLLLFQLISKSFCSFCSFVWHFFILSAILLSWAFIFFSSPSLMEGCWNNAQCMQFFFAPFHVPIFFLFNLRFAFSFISYSVSFACFTIPTFHLPDYCCHIPGSFLEKLKNVRNAHVCRSTWNVLATSKLNLHVWCYGEIHKFWPIVPLLLPAVSNGLWKMKTCYANVPWKFHIKVSCMCVYVRNPRKWM